jgi:hypothetical protein
VGGGDLAAGGFAAIEVGLASTAGGAAIGGAAVAVGAVSGGIVIAAGIALLAGRSMRSPRPAELVHPVVRAVGVGLTIAVCYTIVSVVLLEATDLAPLPIFIVGGVIAWVLMMTTVLRIGFHSRKLRNESSDSHEAR